jgi:hypothetical protein
MHFTSLNVSGARTLATYRYTEQAHLLTDIELLEFIGNENNVELGHLKAKSPKSFGGRGVPLHKGVAGLH